MKDRASHVNFLLILQVNFREYCRKRGRVGMVVGGVGVTWPAAVRGVGNTFFFMIYLKLSASENYSLNIT